MKLTYDIMKRLVQPNIYRLLRNGSRDEYRLADRAEEIAWELHGLLSVFEPSGDDDNRSVWLEIPRGQITDWMTYDEAKEYEDVTTVEEYERIWKECYPCETQWVRLTTAVYENNVFLHLYDGEMGYANYRGDKQGHYLHPVFFEYLESLLNEVRILVKRVLEDVDAYNAYVEEHLPKQIREGRILRKELYRILPWRRPDLEDKEKIVKMLQNCKTYCGEPLDEMTIRTFCKYYRIAYEAFRELDAEEITNDPIDDVEFYRKRHFHKISDKLNLDSEDDFQKFDHDHYGELGFSRTNVLADDYTVPGKWVIRLSISYSSQIWDGLKVALALYETGAPLHIDDAERLLAAVEETDFVRLTSCTFHNYLNWQDETSVYSLPWEYECDYEEYGITREQLQEIIDYSEWMSEQKLKIQHKVPLESPLYDLMRDKVTEPLFLYDIRMKMWKDYDGYVGTSHYSEFAKTGYRPYLNGSKIQQVYATWSEAMTAGLLELIESRKNHCCPVKVPDDYYKV